MSNLIKRAHAVLVLAIVAAQTLAASPAPTVGPHGEGGKINRVNGEDYISYTYIEAPGTAGTPAVFRVTRDVYGAYLGVIKIHLGMQRTRNLWHNVGKVGFDPAFVLEVEEAPASTPPRNAFESMKTLEM